MRKFWKTSSSTHMKMGASCHVLFGKDNSPIQTGQIRRLQVAGLICKKKHGYHKKVSIKIFWPNNKAEAAAGIE